MKYLAICVVVIILVSCGSAQKKNQEQGVDEGIKSVTLELLWETDTVFNTPESVLADKAGGVLYVANMNAGAAPNSGGGFISKVDMQGNIIDLKWATGLNGPKGMGLFENFLYAADNNEVVKISVESGEIIEKIQIDGRPGLNDITMGSDGSVYVSGYNSNVIYKVKDGVVETVFTGEAGENFNGLLWEPDRILLITSSGSTFKSIDWATKTATVIAEEMGHGDGIVPVGNGDYITSDWRGRVFYVPAEGETITLLDTREQEINAADIDYVIENNMLFVPTFYKNTLKAYKVVIE